MTVPEDPDWYLKDYLDFVKIISGLSKDLEQPEPDLSNGSVLELYDNIPSVLTDLLYRSYRNACQVFDRTIYFNPSLSQLRKMRGADALLISYKYSGSPEKALSKGTRVLSITPYKQGQVIPRSQVDITLPYPGKIEFHPLIQAAKVGDELPDTELFRLEFKEIEKTSEKKDKSDTDLKQLILNEMASLHASIVLACHSLAIPKERNRKLKEALAFSFDLNSHRLDAWMSSIANRQLHQMREANPSGIIYGAYGYLEDLPFLENQIAIVEKEGEEFIGEDPNFALGGLIHAPTPAQSVTAAIMKNAFLNQVSLGEEANPFTLKLTSDRIQQALTLMDGIRQGQEMEALLGYRLERYLHEHPGRDLHGAIFKLRRMFPLVTELLVGEDEQNPNTSLTVINGLALLHYVQNLSLDSNSLQARKKQFAKKITQKSEPFYKGLTNESILHVEEAEELYEYVLKLEDSLDGTLDALFFEAGYQVINGNMARAAAAMDASKGALDPPELESLNTRIPGKSILHKLVLIFPPGKSENKNSPKQFVEPHIERWLKDHIGPLTNFSCEVEITGSETNVHPVQIEKLGISHSDLFYLCMEPVNEGAGELEQRIITYLRESLEVSLPESYTYKIKSNRAANSNEVPLNQALEIFKYAYFLLTQATPISSEHLHPSGEEVPYDWDTLDSYRTERLLPLISELANRSNREIFELLDPSIQSKKPQWYRNLNKIPIVKICGSLNFEEAKKVFQPTPSFSVEKLQAEIDKKVLMALKQLKEYTDNVSVLKGEGQFPQAFKLLRNAIRTLLGKDFLLLPPALPSKIVVEALNNKNKQKSLLGDKEEKNTKIQEWVQSVATTFSKVESLEDWQMVLKVWQQKLPNLNSYKRGYYLVQHPTGLEYPWVGLDEGEIKKIWGDNKPHTLDQLIRRNPEFSFLERDQVYPDYSESIILYGSNEMGARNGTAQFGFLIESFSESIPDEEINTGLTFHYDAPNTEAPQSMLLVTYPQYKNGVGYEWEISKLQDVVCETMDLAKIRLLDLQDLEEYSSIIPFSNFLHFPRKK